MLYGFLNIYKPSGPTSHDIVNMVRRGTGVRRVGHAGTLDPLAEGVLVVAVGTATRLLEYLQVSRKSYTAEITLGLSTDTLDTEGEILEMQNLPVFSATDVKGVLQGFVGEISQVPPAYSAIKVNGKPAYSRARNGEDLALEPRLITIFDIGLKEIILPVIRVEVECSAGTYIRSLARDIGEALGCGATLSGLCRTASGNFTADRAVTLEELHLAFEAGVWQQHLVSADMALDGTPRLYLSEEDAARIENGIAVRTDAVTQGLARAYSPDGQFLAVVLGEPDTSTWRPKKVFKST